MCGIFGAVHLFQEKPLDLGLKLSKLSKRGPDDSGIYTARNIALGHTRLAIQDVENGHQPMLSQSKHFIVVFNGEVYNHLELRELLPDHNWKTLSDTETLVELFEAFGDKIFQKVIGMYAVGIWDITNKKLTLARDKYGEKPLYFIAKPESIVFCSEPSCILDKKLSAEDINTDQFPYFIKYGYLPINLSIIKDVEMLSPGEILEWGHGSIYRKSIYAVNSKKSTSHLNKQLVREKIYKAVERTLVADHQVGVMLSGGIDSSLLATLATNIGGPLPTYTVALTKNSQDIQFSRLVAKKINSQHHEILIDSNTLADEIENVLSQIPHPFADSALIPTYLLARYAKNQVNVLLSGDGADEVFAGYSYYDKYRNIEDSQTSKFLSISKELKFNVLSRTKYKLLNQLREEVRFSRLSSGRISLQDSWNQDLAAFLDSEIDRMHKSATTKINKGELKVSNQTHPFWKILESDRLHYLGGNILQKSDIGGMLASVEIRAPYLDIELNEYLSDVVKNPNQLSKKILYDACFDLLPDEVFKRRKMGFGAPLDEWFGNPKVSKLIGSVLDNRKSFVYNFFDFDQSARIIKKSNLKKWNFFVLAFWLQRNV